MSRQATINVSLTSQQLRLVRQRVRSGDYGSASEVVRESLRLLFGDHKSARRTSAKLQELLAAGYRTWGGDDRRAAQGWSELDDAWPEE